jgi:ribonucleoside-diphosphate reductase alpha chain
VDVLPLSAAIWKSRYRYVPRGGTPERDIAATWQRVARAIAAVEQDSDHWHAIFLSVLTDFLFLPGGRVLAGAGTNRRVTLFNCFAAGRLVDSVEGILDSLKESALTMQRGGGIGCDFSNLRPSGSPAAMTGTRASGPLPFMHIWDSLCETMLATSSRRGAMMGTLRCDHPDIEAFIAAKTEPGVLSNFNLSVLVSDEFMQAVAENAQWQLVYPAPPATGRSSGSRDSQNANPDLACRVYRRLPARSLFNQMIRAAHTTAEPGMLFIDNINRNNNLYYRETISAANPCGEIPLPPHGACDLGSLNLTALVLHPFTANTEFDWQKLHNTVKVAVRFLDNVIDASRFPLEAQASQARGTRRIGLGITGLADMLAMLRLSYDSDEGRAFARRVMEMIRNTAYETSIELAKAKGPFPFFDKARYLEAPFIGRLPGQLRAGIAEYGIRNSHLLAIAPTGTISLLAGNVSSGIEPIYALAATREIRQHDLKVERMDIEDYAYQQWQASTGRSSTLPESFVTADRISAGAHLAMQACLQPFVDNAISKTVNLPADASLDDVDQVFQDAYALGLKGCTVFRPGARQGQVLRSRDEAHCCHVDREAD